MIIAKSMSDSKTVRPSTPALTHWSGEKSGDNSNNSSSTYVYIHKAINAYKG